MTASATVYNADCLLGMRRIPKKSVDAVITDPPYFLDGLGDDWGEAKQRKQSKGTQVKSLPIGMKFDPQQGRDFQTFMGSIARESMRILKPGGFLLAMSSPRLYHRLAVGVEDEGFEIRDLWAWVYTQNQMKAMSVERFLAEGRLSPAEEERVRRELQTWKTPQVKSCLEPMVLAQKPKLDAEGKPATFLENWLTHHVGLVNIATGMGEAGDKATANVMTTENIGDEWDKAFLVSKPSASERTGSTHLSVKPLALMHHLVASLVPSGGLVVDPFNGSGSTGIAALGLGVGYIGFEKEESYFNESAARFESVFGGEALARGEGVFTVENND